MAKGKGGLGRGLESLFEDAAPSLESDAKIETLPLREIEPDPDQPRKTFDEEALGELAASIAEHGLLQPIAVEPGREDAALLLENLELLEQLNGEHCLTFYGYQHDRDRILEALKKHRKDLRVRVYKTVEDEEAWNNGEVDVLLVHPASCAYGLNLQAGGQHVVWYGLNWSFELNDQGNCRLYRQGSPYDKVFVHYLVVQGCQDEDVMATVRDRQDTHEAVMSALKARIKRVKESAK